MCGLISARPLFRVFRETTAIATHMVYVKALAARHAGFVLSSSSPSFISTLCNRESEGCADYRLKLLSYARTAFTTVAHMWHYLGKSTRLRSTPGQQRQAGKSQSNLKLHDDLELACQPSPQGTRERPPSPLFESRRTNSEFSCSPRHEKSAFIPWSHQSWEGARCLLKALPGSRRSRPCKGLKRQEALNGTAPRGRNCYICTGNSVKLHGQLLSQSVFKLGSWHIAVSTI